MNSKPLNLLLFALILLISLLSTAIVPLDARAHHEKVRVWTDKGDYLRGEVVSIQGEYFHRQTNLTLTVTWPANSDRQDTLTVTTDDSGFLLYHYQQLPPDAAQGLYTVEVFDTEGELLASTFFSISPEVQIEGDSPRVWTDKGDYLPGELVTISGQNFAPQAELTLAVTWPADYNRRDTAIIAVDNAGQFIYPYQLPPPPHAGQGLYTVEVFDSEGHLLATTTFLDSHFSGISITWKPVGGNSIRFTVQSSWRRSAFGTPTGGSTVNIGSLSTGDGASLPLNSIVTSMDPAADSMNLTAVVTRTYAATGNYTAFFIGCCRLSTLINNADGNYRAETIVNVGTGNRSPVSGMAPIVNCNTSSTCTFPITASDPDNNSLTYRFATATEGGGGFTQPGGATINPTTGIYTWNTPASPGLYSTQVMIEDGASKVALDFMIRVVTPVGSAPQFTAPNCGSTFNVAPGYPLNFAVQTSDADAGNTVTLDVSSLPLGATMTPNLVVTGNPASSAFSWTPNTGDEGRYVLTFYARDNAQQQRLCPVILSVGGFLVGNFVWEDLNQDGIQDAGESGLNGVTVNLYRDDGDNVPEPGGDDGTPVATTVTANNGSTDGFYQFATVPDSYFLEFVQPTGFTRSLQNQGGNDTLDSDATPTTGLTDVFLVFDQNILTLAAGMYGTPEATVGNFVWNDLNMDGIQDGGETGLNGITVRLYQDNGDNTPNLTTDYLIDTTATANNGSTDGFYEFDQLAAGNYFVAFTRPSTYTFSPQDQGTDDTLNSDANPATGLTTVFFLPDAANDDTRDAGLVPPGTIGDYVWIDTNQNGLQDAGETGLNGVTVRVYRDNGDNVPNTATDTLTGTTTTASGGLYQFTVAPGNYFIQFVLPGSRTFSSQDQGSDDTLDSDPDPATGLTIVFPVTPASTNLSRDAGLSPFPDLQVSKANSIAGVGIVGGSFTWTLTLSNTGGTANFSSGQTILIDNLPNSGATYGTPVVQNVTNVSNLGNIQCTIVSNNLSCIANGGTVGLGANTGRFEVAIPVTPTGVGSLQNPRGGGICWVDPNSLVNESNESNNSCNTNTVTVLASLPPTIDIGTIGLAGPNLQANIDISDPENDPLSGVVEIQQSKGAPVSATLETLSTACGGAKPLVLSLNGSTIGQATAPANCTCAPGIGTVTFTGSQLAANFNPASNNTWTFSKATGVPYTAWAKVTVQYADATTQTSCLFDEAGGTCSGADLCAAGYTDQVISAPSILSPGTTTLISQSYSNSQLPTSLNTSSLASGPYLLYGTTTDGVSTDTDIEPFTLSGQPQLLINSDDDDGDGVVNVNDTCPGTTSGLAVDASGCPTVAGIVAASDDPADGGYDLADLTDVGLTGLVSGNLDAYEEAIASASPTPTTLADLQAIIDQVNLDQGDDDGDGVINVSDTCPGTTSGLAVDASGCPTVAGVVAASDDPADGGYDLADLTDVGLTGLVSGNLDAYEEAIASASPAPGTVAELQAIIDQVNNQAPFANAGPDQNVNPNAVVTLDGTDSEDLNGDLPLTYGWVQTGGPAVTLSSATAVSPTFTAPATPTVLTFSLTVTDSLGLADPTPDEVVITVNDGPITGLNATNSSPTLLGNVTNFTASLSGGSNVSYQWNFGDGQTGSGPMIPHTYNAPGTYTAIVTASNSTNLLTATTQVEIITSTPGGGSNVYYLPFIFKNATPTPTPGPDLVVESLSAGSNGLILTIKNIGDAPVTNAFWVDVYFDPTQTPSLNKPWDTLADHGAVWGVTGAGLNQLGPGGTLTLISGGAYYFATDSSSLPFPEGAQVYALVDSVNHNSSYGNIQESNEDNNLKGPVVSSTTVGELQTVAVNEPVRAGLPQR